MISENIRNIQVDILLSTYNGEKYLEELLDSIERQTHKNWFLYIRDDGSNDSTEKIIENFSIKYPNKVKFFKGNNLGVKKSFEILMKSSESEYILFCDQDDVWLENKITLLLEKIVKIETENKFPTLVFSDMIVIDENLNLISDSFWNYHGINPIHTGLNRLLIQNVVTGCAVIINRNLALLINNIPKNAIMHDWWLALCASVAGRIDFLKLPTLKYRMHGQNQIGAQSANIQRILKENIKTVMEKVNKIYETTSKQAEELNCFTEEERLSEIIEDYISLGKKSFFQRIAVIVKRKFYFSKFIRTLAFIIFLKREK